MRETCMLGSVRGAPSNGPPYRDSGDFAGPTTYLFTGYATKTARVAGAALMIAARRRHQPTINPSERRAAIPSAATSSAAPCWR